jgi:hypothetical protein
VCGDANAYGISTVGAEHHCDGRARNFFDEAASNLVGRPGIWVRAAAKSDGHVIGPQMTRSKRSRT